MNQIYQTYFVMFGITIAAAISQSVNYKRSGKFDLNSPKILGWSISANIILYFMAGVHFLQFIAVNMQLFSKENQRKDKKLRLQCVQYAGIFAIPTFLILVESITLGIFWDVSKDEIFYKWVIADLMLNIFGSLAYIIQLENIRKE